VLGFIVKRLLWTVVLMAVISFITFIIFFILPSDARSVQSGRGSIDPNLQGQFNLKDQSVPEQYAHFIWGVVRHGTLGHSFREGVDVSYMIKQALPVTAALVIGGGVMFFLIAFPIGFISALRPRSLLDKGLMTFVLIGVSFHPVFLGLGLSWLFGYKWPIFPISGYCDFFKPDVSCGGPVQWTYHMILPWITFAFLFAALYARMIRASVIETLGEDYVRTARAKGASTGRILRSHVFKNAMLPIVSMMGMDLSLAFAGSIFIETVYGLPGMGKMLVTALSRRDLPVIMGVVLVVALAVAIANLIADILYSTLDPRIRVTGRGEGSGDIVAPRRARQPQVKEAGAARPA
jgi:peptide/nickel transport system permease protein